MQDYLRFLVTLTAVLDPFLAVPIFLTVTASHSARARVVLVRVVAITVFAVLAASALVGDTILTLMGASLAAFRVGGGLVLLLMSLAMLNAQVGGVRQSEEEAAELQSGEVRGLVPLAIPLLAGPGALTSIMLLIGDAADLGAQIRVLASLAAVMALALLTLLAATQVGRLLGVTGANVVTRVLGVVLAALATQFVIDGVRESFGLS